MSSSPTALNRCVVYFSSRYPGFDLEDPDRPDARAKLKQVSRLLETVRARLGAA